MRVTYFYAVMQSDCRGVVPSPGFSKSPLMPGKGKGKGAWMDKLCLCTEKSDLTNIWCSFACNSILSTWAVKQLGFWLFRGIGKGQNWFLSYTNLKWLNAPIESLWWSRWKKRFLMSGSGHWSSLNIHSFEHKSRLSRCFLLQQTKTKHFLKYSLLGEILSLSLIYYR